MKAFYALILVLMAGTAYGQSLPSYSLSIGPFLSSFELPLGWNSEEQSMNQARAIYEREGMNSDPNYAINFGKEMILIASWQNFKPSTAVSVPEMISEIPTFQGIKKSDITMFSQSTTSTERFEYAFFRGVGYGNDFSITGNGNSKYIGYWIHMPLQYTDTQGNLYSGMLSLFARALDSSSNKKKMDKTINDYLNSLNLKDSLTKQTFDSHRKLVLDQRLKKELEQEMVKSNTNEPMKFGPFISNFQASADFKSGHEAYDKARELFANDGIESNIDFAMSGNRDGLFIVSWQFFEPSMAFSADQLTSSIPTYEFVKKADTKVFPSSTNNANQFEYAITRATGWSNDNLTFALKGKSRIVAYWVNMPIQAKNSNGERLSGMLSVFYRGSEREYKRNKIDSVIPAFMNSLEFKEGFSKISYENYKAEIQKKNIQRELETEVKTTVATDNKVDSSLSSKLTKPQLDLFERKEKQLAIEAKRLAEERRRLDAEKAQREQEKKASRIAIKGSASQPDANGDFTITIQTGADTASLKIDGEEVGGKRDGNYVIKRVARVGEQNSYLITARDVFGNTDSATVTVARQVADSRPAIPRLNPSSVKVQQSRDAVAIIIGIENYRRVPKADFANADAKDFYTYASRALGIKPENIKLLVDDGADDIEILNAFQNWLPLKVNKGKTDVYVFYSGHGYPSQDGSSLYFLPFNVDKQYLERTSVKQKEVVAALQKAQAKSVTMFIDACYSGQTRGGEVLIAGLKPIVAKTDEKAYPPEFTVITASAADQFSSASQDLKHGIFSFYLMKGMEGDADVNKDGRITSGELQQYLSEMVGRQAMGLNRTQNTQLFGDANKVLVGR